MKKLFFSLLLSISVLEISAQQVKSSVSVNESIQGLYFGLSQPANIPELFAPEIVSDELSNRDVAISNDGKEIYFGISTPDFRYAAIVVSEMKNGLWSKPEVASFSRDSRYKFVEPAFSPDGKRLYFVSDMPKAGNEKPGDEDIWYVERTPQGWSSPVNIGSPVNTDGGEFFPSFTKNGDMYFTRNEAGVRTSFIYKAVYKDGNFVTPEKLPEQINCGSDRFNAYIFPDESFAVVPAVDVESGLNGAFYYIVFRNNDGSWEKPVNMGKEFNTPVGRGWSFYISPDRRFAFFMATLRKPESGHPEVLSVDFLKSEFAKPQNGNPDIYWISTDVIRKLAAANGKEILK